MPRVFQLTYCAPEHEQHVSQELLNLYEKLRNEHPEYRFDFYQVGEPMVPESVDKVGHA